MKEKTFKLGQDRRTGRFVPIREAKKNLDRYEIVEVPEKGYE